MVVIAISGSGIGAGKTTFAKKFGHPVWSLAGGLRYELSRIYPNYDWENRTQEYKDKTIVKEAGKKTIRQVLVEHGQHVCATNPDHYVSILAERLKGGLAPQPIVAIDDVRKVLEVNFLRSKFPKTNEFMHIHIHWDKAIYEPEFENEELAKIADYIITRNK